MTVRFDGQTIALLRTGMVVHPVTLLLRDAQESKPDKNATVAWLLLRGPVGGCCWEQGEWQSGEGMAEAGWYFIGATKKIEDADYDVLLWCHEPPVPNMEKLGWFDEA